MKALLGIVFAFLLGSCQSAPRPEPLELTSYSEKSLSQPAIGCKSILDSYCRELFAPTALGNLIVDPRQPIQILQGETANQLPQVFYRYSLAKIKNQRKFPPDFLRFLNKYSYFQTLEEFINRRPLQKMNLEERLEMENTRHRLGAIWQSAMDQTVVSRMAAKFKGYHQISAKLMPIEYEVEQRRIRRRLISEFSRILWREDANWRRVADGFNDLKASFMQLFDELDIPADVAGDWREKISSVELVLPGSLPEIADEECSTTTMNAYYYKYLNIVTVCAGDFNSEDVILTLAHEMSHALGIDRDLYLHLQSSALGQSLHRLRQNVCEPKAEISCENWAQLKEKIASKTDEIRDFEVPLRSFNQCLRKSTDMKAPTEADYARVAEKIARNRMARFASSGLFLRLIKRELPLRNGKLQTNPNYMNPCSYYLWSKNEEPLDNEIYSLIFFAAEYRCQSGDEGVRLKNAIDVSQKMTGEITKAVLQAEGEFSDSAELVAENFASPPHERFADVVGTYAVAEYLQKFGSLAERRSKYLASSSWLCQEPSLESRYPEESKIVQLFNLDSHSRGDERQMEYLSKPMREALRCEKDFTFNECELPFKKTRPTPQ